MLTEQEGPAKLAACGQGPWCTVLELVTAMCQVVMAQSHQSCTASRQQIARVRQVGCALCRRRRFSQNPQLVVAKPASVAGRESRDLFNHAPCAVSSTTWSSFDLRARPRSGVFTPDPQARRDDGFRMTARCKFCRVGASSRLLFGITQNCGLCTL